jgi:hypothetical protein
MKALVYYCRWQGAVLRLRGRDKTAVWGHLVTTDEAGQESGQTFRFELATSRLILTEPDGEETAVILDEMGTVVEK